MAELDYDIIICFPDGLDYWSDQGKRDFVGSGAGDQLRVFLLLWAFPGH